jgi:hypothetical protein
MAGRNGKVFTLQGCAVTAGCALSVMAVSNCGGSTLQPATIYLSSEIGPTTSGPMAETCPVASMMPQLIVGSVQSGVAAPSGMVACAVIKSGSDYQVSGQVNNGSGSFRISGSIPAGGGGSLSVSLAYGQVGAPQIFSQPMGCTAELATGGGSFPGFDPGAGPPIAPGRVWANVTCKNMLVSGSASGATCLGTFLFRFENCMGSPSS